MSNTQIAQTLTVAETTVKTHVARILAKLSLRDRAQAVVVAYESELIQPGIRNTTPPPPTPTGRSPR